MSMNVLLVLITATSMPSAEILRAPSPASALVAITVLTALFALMKMIASKIDTIVPLAVFRIAPTLSAPSPATVSLAIPEAARTVSTSMNAQLVSIHAMYTQLV
jgi:hypothetical protein